MTARTIPDRTELVRRSLNYLTQAETTLDVDDTAQNALIGIGYAILADAQATDGLENSLLDILGEFGPNPRGWYMGDGTARDLSGKPYEPLNWDNIRR